MKTLEKSQDKLQKITDLLRQETIEPAKKEAERIIEEAKTRGDKIIADAKNQAEIVLEEARQTIEKERNVYHSALSQAIKQSLEALRQSIEKKFLNEDLHNLIVKNAADPAVIAKVIAAIISAIEKEGTSADLSIIIPASVSVKEVNQLLGENLLKKLKNGSVIIGDIAGGTKITLQGKNITLEITDKEVEEILKRYIRKDFRKMFFNPD